MRESNPTRQSGTGEKKRISKSRMRRIRQLRMRMALCAVCVILITLTICLIAGGKKKEHDKQEVAKTGAKPQVVQALDSTPQIPVASNPLRDGWLGVPEVESAFLDVNKYSRPGKTLPEVNSIVVHYVGNPNTTAMQNRDYFNELPLTKERKASSHYIVGLDGEILQCVPNNEVSYASNDRNYDTIAIETCHPDETGKFNDMTYQSLVQLTAWLCLEYDLGRDGIIRHYDVTGKVCPKYYVENPEAWEQFLDDVMYQIEEAHKIIQY